MKIEEIKDILGGNPFFEGMDPGQVEFVAGCGKLVHFEAGEFLLKEGDEANKFFIVRHGDVAIESYVPTSGPLTTMTIREKGIVGYSWLYPPYRNGFDARAMNSVSAIEMDGECLRKKGENDHELGYELMKRFAHVVLDRLQATRRQMLDVYATQMENKADAA